MYTTLKDRSPIIGIFVAVLLCIIFLTGCRMLGGEDKPTVETEPPLAPENIETMGEGSGERAGPPGETIEVVLYFADREGKKLVPENRKIKKVEGLARATINELIKGPSQESDLLPTIPQGTVLRDINIKDDGLCIVDFNKKLMEKNSTGVIPEELTVYSIVNTLTQFPAVERVKFRVEGQDPRSMGNISLSDTPLMENNRLIKE
ncbi:MAG: GerMN domain-containing protein [Clostridia bacterium]|nr:GerMN domain-containing protein [Clostridia bacterium]